MKNIKSPINNIASLPILVDRIAFVIGRGIFMPIVKICEVCGKHFAVKPSHYDGRKCCSKECQNINQKKKVGELNNNYRGGPKIQKCHYCKNDFIPNNPYFKRKYYSNKCSSNSKIGNKLNEKSRIAFEETRIKRIFLAESNPKHFCSCGNKKDLKAKNCRPCFVKLSKYKRPKVCPGCNIDFDAKIESQTYCSKKCFIDHLLIRYTQENNPNWKGGIKSLNQIGRETKLHKDWRKSVFERDKYTCQKCKQVGWELHAHHIKRWSQYKELRFDIDNGITLCKSCHFKEHSRKTNNSPQ